MKLVSARSPVGLREALVFIRIAAIPNITVVSGGAIYQRYKFIGECRSITNDLIQFIADRKKGAPQPTFPLTPETLAQTQRANTAYDADTEALYQKRFATRLRVACDRVRSYRPWNPGAEEMVCFNPGMGSIGVLFRPQSVEAFALELSSQDWMTSRTALQQAGVGLLVSFVFWLIFANLKRTANDSGTMGTAH